MTEPHATEQDVFALAEKLETFGGTLAPGERAALAAMVELAARGAQGEPSQQVTGHMFGDLTTALLAEARQQEYLAEADRARQAAQASASQVSGETPWDRLRRRLSAAGEGQLVPRWQPAAESSGGS